MRRSPNAHGDERYNGIGMDALGTERVRMWRMQPFTYIRIHLADGAVNDMLDNPSSAGRHVSDRISE